MGMRRTSSFKVIRGAGGSVKRKSLSRTFAGASFPGKNTKPARIISQNLVNLLRFTAFGLSVGKLIIIFSGLSRESREALGLKIMAGGEVGN